MKGKLNSPIRETDDAARAQGRALVQNAKFAALATLEKDSNVPMASRISFATQENGTPFSLMSTLAYHTKALISHPACSLLVGEPGKGDPLAHPRITLQADAEQIPHDSDAHTHLRAVYLNQHPKAELYIDFLDFFFFRFSVHRAYLNGGFGKAYELTASDLLAGPKGIS